LSSAIHVVRVLLDRLQKTLGLFLAHLARRSLGLLLFFLGLLFVL
jgi:hypothetical protein